MKKIMAIERKLIYESGSLAKTQAENMKK